MYRVNLKKLIKEKDVTISQLGRQIGVSPKTIFNWLNGAKPQDIEQVLKVADYFNLSLEYLLTGKIKSVTSKDVEHKILKYEDEINAGIYEVILRRVKND